MLGPLHTAGGHVKGCSCCGKQFGISSKNDMLDSSRDPAISLRGTDPNKNLHVDVHSSIFTKVSR